MRIVQLANFVTPGSGGIRTMLEALARGYAERGVERALVVPGPRDAVSRDRHGVCVQIGSPRLPASGGYRVITRLREVSRILDRLVPHSVEVSDRWTLVPVGAWAARAGVGSLAVAHERLDATLEHRLPGLFRHQPAADWWNQRLGAAFDTVVCASAFAAEEFTSAGVRNVAQVPLGVDLDRFTPARRSPPLRRRLAAPGEALLVLCSRLSSEKRPGRAVDAVRSLVRRGVPVRLCVAGDGPERRSLEAAATGLPITFLGHVSDRDALAALLATADVALAPSPAETFGLAALEALACGTPVVCAGSGALPELLGTRGAPAGLATAGYGPTLAAGVLAVLDWDPGHRAAAARRRAEDFPWQATVDRMLTLHRGGTLPAASSGMTALPAMPAA
ncbi:MAG: glycosyltransferase [Egibacteraceae bacterium]